MIIKKGKTWLYVQIWGTAPDYLYWGTAVIVPKLSDTARWLTITTLIHTDKLVVLRENAGTRLVFYIHKSLVQ